MITTQTIDRPAPRPAEILLDRMVEKVLELGMNGVAVTRDALYEHSDFSRAEIDAYAAEACDLARSRAVTQRAA